MSETVLGLFPQDQQAKETIPALISRGIAQKDIDLICTRDTAGGGARAAGSDLIARLSRLGLADSQRQCYIDGVNRGGTLVAARTDDEARADEAAAIMREHGASNCAHAASAAPSAQATQRQARNEPGSATIPVVEEELQVGKRAVESGGVRVRQQVSERPVEAEVNLRDERVKIERRAVDRPVTDADRDAAFSEKTIEMHERSEKPVVQKTARVVEEVVVNKDVEQHKEKVRDKVRRTDVDVEKMNPDDQRQA